MRKNRSAVLSILWWGVQPPGTGTFNSYCAAQTKCFTSLMLTVTFSIHSGCLCYWQTTSYMTASEWRLYLIKRSSFCRLEIPPNKPFSWNIPPITSSRPENGILRCTFLPVIHHYSPMCCSRAVLFIISFRREITDSPLKAKKKQSFRHWHNMHFSAVF